MIKYPDKPTEHQLQLQHRQYPLLSKMCCMFRIFHKAIIRHKYANTRQKNSYLSYIFVLVPNDGFVNKLKHVQVFTVTNKQMSVLYYIINIVCLGDHSGTVVKVLCYKSEGRWFDLSWCHWNFLLI